MTLRDLLADPARRAAAFPVTGECIYLAHAAVAPLSGPARDAMIDFATRGAINNQEGRWAEQQVGLLRKSAAQLLSARPSEISLIGPTAMGLNTVALGISWAPGDEVIYYGADYPANVYPWMAAADQGARPIALTPTLPGVITWELIEAALTERTRLVALASCHFLTGYRPDLDHIGRELGKRSILFSVDGIQTLGAFPLSVEHIVFVSADSHKWLLGPVGAGLFFCKREHYDTVIPRVLGSWNVISPDFIAQQSIAYHNSGQRYEPGTLNIPGAAAMQASISLLLECGIDAIAARLLELRARLLAGVRSKGYVPILAELEDQSGADHWRSGILTLTHPSHDLKAIYRSLADQHIVTSLRHDAAGRPWLRLSPHAYLLDEDIDRAIAALP